MGSSLVEESSSSIINFLSVSVMNVAVQSSNLGNDRIEKQWLVRRCEGSDIDEEEKLTSRMIIENVHGDSCSGREWMLINRRRSGLKKEGYKGGRKSNLYSAKTSGGCGYERELSHLNPIMVSQINWKIGQIIWEGSVITRSVVKCDIEYGETKQ